LQTSFDRICDPAAGAPCLVIGEVAQAHDGSLGLAHAFVDAVANAGADAIKFQTHIAAAESTEREPWRVKFSLQDDTRRDYWKRMEFTEPQWAGLVEHARDRGVLFLSSPFSLEAVQMLDRLGVPAWKVASGELGNEPMLDAMSATGRPMLLSTGMSPLAEIDRLVARWREARVPFALLQCTSAYPCPPERVGLNLIPFFRERYGCAVGLSDHSGTIYPGLAGAVLGMALLEVHVTLSREMFGPDVSASVTTSELRQLVDGIRFIEAMNAHPVDKDAAAELAAPMRALFTRSIVARRDLTVGAVLAADDLTLKKPGTGLPPVRLPELIGRRLRRPLRTDELIEDDDLEWVAE
jgi:N-acetylneuraminate synthase